MTLILGAGLAGLSASYHIGHENCLVLEKNAYPGGHIHSEFRDGFTWDEGPHVSFTKNEYVKNLFAESVQGEFEEYDVRTANYFHGHWIDHPAQSSFYQLPEPLRSQCLSSFLESRKRFDTKEPPIPSNYQEWLEIAFGKVFAETFPAAYTRKYWTREPCEMTTDWIGNRVFFPKVADVVEGSRGPLSRPTHYITHVRYPKSGGFESFAADLMKGCQIKYGAEVAQIDLWNRKVHLTDSTEFSYTRLINTLPLPAFIGMCVQVPADILEAAETLSCSQLLLVNVTAPHPTQRPENWIYVYDAEKYSTRISCTEKLAPGNAPKGWTGLQVEVYSSRHRPLPASQEAIGKRVVEELLEMGLVKKNPADQDISFYTQNIPWANIIFDHATKPALEKIWQWLEGLGLSREDDDLHPIVDWGKRFAATPEKLGTLIMAGRFGQWKYFWTDDCLLRGKAITDLIHNS